MVQLIGVPGRVVPRHLFKIPQHGFLTGRAISFRMVQAQVAMTPELQ